MKIRSPTRIHRNGHSKGKLKRAKQDEKLTLGIALALQKQLFATRDYAEAVIGAAPPLLILDEKLCVLTANEAFCNVFKIPFAEAINRRVFELGNGQWNIPKLRTLLEKVLPRKSFFKDFEVTHTFEHIGNRTMLLGGRQVDHLQRILLLVEDITERRAAQASIRTSEIRYRRLFETAQDGILILDPESRKITDANPFMTELLGYPHKELLGKELWEIGLLKDEKSSQEAFRELKRKHFIRYEDLPLQAKGGERHEVEFVSNLYDEGGRKVIQCNIRDITERKQAGIASMRLAAIVESSDYAIISKDLNSIITSWNKGAEKIFGYTASEMMGTSIMRLIPADRLGEEKHLLGKIERGEKSEHFETLRQTKAGRLIDVSVMVSPIKDASGKVIGAAKVARDITTHRLAEEALLTANNKIARHAHELEKVVEERTGELRETIGELEGFSYSVSHDMRAPLRAMQSFAQFLVDDYSSKLDEQGVHYLQQIMRSAVRLDRLIQDVLSYTRILHSKLPMERVDLDRLVRDMVEAFPKGQPLKPEIHIKGKLPKVMGNEALLAQCVSNLVNNGIKFVAPGTTPDVEISAEEVDLTEGNKGNGDASRASVRISFKDNGIGIAPENHERIFRLFERIHPTTQYEGTGIGLTIVRKAAERMDAQVGFESELGEGSSFWIQLKKG
ncbi:MAG: two-component system, chemotaxis family, CheB/CheR fusion protein [Verrucomicrobiota bacterium]